MTEAIIHPGPTVKEVKDFAKHMFDYYNLKPVLKTKSWLMRIVGWFLHKIDYMDKETFMKNYTTSLRKKVYLSFKIGDPKTLRLDLQFGLITHECQHSEQRRKRGNFKFNREYAFSSSKRAMYEAEAYRSNMELHFWYTGRIISPAVLASKLLSYGCSHIDVSMARMMLEGAVEVIKSGGVVTDSTKLALMWIGKNLPEHKRKGLLLPSRYYE